VNLVSIVMAAFNTERFVGESITSVVRQTYANWELLVVDDASSDRTVQIVEQFAATDPRVKLVALKKNVGPAVARNEAIRRACGRYIAFLDSDDQWLPEKLQIQISEMARLGATLSFTAYRKIDAAGRIGQGIVSVPSTITYSKLLNTNVIGCLTAMYDAGVTGKIYMPELDLRQDYGLWLQILKRSGHEDYGLWLRLLRGIHTSPSAAGAIGINQPLALYRVHANTVSSNKLKAAMYQWMVYRRQEGLSIPRAIYHFMNYAYHGLRKYRIK
jgi:teichuronic acid biosynthesis glycosyltransferase TuaG